VRETDRQVELKPEAGARGRAHNVVGIIVAYKDQPTHRPDLKKRNIESATRAAAGSTTTVV
jgi:beta-lactam-binding protein with PASTA domain